MANPTAKSRPQLRLLLTDEQRVQVQQAFGQDVDAFTVSVEDFPTSGGEVTMRVLKVNNIAVLSGRSIVDVVN